MATEGCSYEDLRDNLVSLYGDGELAADILYIADEAGKRVARALLDDPFWVQQTRAVHLAVLATSATALGQAMAQWAIKKQTNHD